MGRIIKQFKTMAMMSTVVAVLIGVVFTTVGFGFSIAFRHYAPFDQMRGNSLLLSVGFGALAGVIAFCGSMLLLSRDLLATRARIRKIRAQLETLDDMPFEEFEVHFIGIRTRRLKRIRLAISQFYGVSPEKIHPELDMPELINDLRLPMMSGLIVRRSAPERTGRVTHQMGAINNVYDFVVETNRQLKRAR